MRIRAMTRVVGVVWAMCIALVTSIGAQVPGNQSVITLNGGETARVPGLVAVAGQLVVVTAARGGERPPAIFVYDRESRLVAKNDEQRANDEFTWLVPVDGTYEVVLYSNSNESLAYTVRVAPREPNRAAAPEPSNLVRPVFYVTDR